jgi:hypothetical protein
MTGVLATVVVAVAILLGSVLWAAVTDMCKDEVRTRLSRFPYLLIRVAALRIPRAARSDLTDEWEAELDYILRSTEGLPLTRLLRGVIYSADLLLRGAPAVAREIVAAKAGSELASGIGPAQVADTTWSSLMQYERMLKSYDRLTEYARGRQAASSTEARDALIHFFLDAYHLKDWLQNDHGVQAIGNQPAKNLAAQHIKNALEKYVSSTLSLQLCADIANGSKHPGLKPAQPGKSKNGPNTGDVITAVTGQSVMVRPATACSSMGPRPAIHSWRIESGGNSYDALDTADKIVVAWQAWLRQNGLLP